MNQRVPKEWETEFYAGRRTKQVPFALNDYVKITSGPLAGQHGSVISIKATEPALAFLVEMESGKDEILASSMLQFIAADY